MKFIKKPLVVDAGIWEGKACELEDYEWFREATEDGIVYIGDDPDLSLKIETLEGLMTALPGDWIIKGIKGEIYSCKPDIFEATYEPVAKESE